jgi:hypothetical protein
VKCPQAQAPGATERAGPHLGLRLLEQRGDLALGLDVGRHAAGGRLGAAFPGRLHVAAAGLRRAARRTGRPALAPRAGRSNRSTRSARSGRSTAFRARRAGSRCASSTSRSSPVSPRSRQVRRPSLMRPRGRSSSHSSASSSILLLEQLLEVGDQPAVAGRHQRHRQARGARAAGAADAVDVVLGVERHVEVEDRRHVLDVQAARGHVGGHQQVDLAGLEGGQRLQALVLALVAVQRGGLEPLALQRAGQPGATQLAVDEDERLREPRWRMICLTARRLSSSDTL